MYLLPPDCEQVTDDLLQECFGVARPTGVMLAVTVIRDANVGAVLIADAKPKVAMVMDSDASNSPPSPQLEVDHPMPVAPASAATPTVMTLPPSANVQQQQPQQHAQHIQQQQHQQPQAYLTTAAQQQHPGQPVAFQQHHSQTVTTAAAAAAGFGGLQQQAAQSGTVIFSVFVMILFGVANKCIVGKGRHAAIWHSRPIHALLCHLCQLCSPMFYDIALCRSAMPY